MGFGSLGFSELAVIFIIVLVFFGPRRFPEIARSMGSAMREFRRSLNQIQRELEEVDPRKDIPGKDILDEIRTGKPADWLDPNKSKPDASALRARSGTSSRLLPRMPTSTFMRIPPFGMRSIGTDVTQQGVSWPPARPGPAPARPRGAPRPRPRSGARARPSA